MKNLACLDVCHQKQHTFIAGPKNALRGSPYRANSANFQLTALFSGAAARAFAIVRQAANKQNSTKNAYDIVLSKIKTIRVGDFRSRARA